VIGPRGQYLCDIDLRGKEITVPGSGGVTSEPDPEVQGGSLPLPMSVDDWKPLAYLPNVRAMSTPGAKVNPTPAVARVSAATGHLYAAPSPNERERFRKWVVRSGAEERRQYLADRAVLEMAIPKALSNLRVVLAWAGNEVGLVLRPAEGDSTADVVVVISSHCCLSKSADVVENQGPPIEDLQGYEKFVSVKTDLSRGVVLLPEDVHFTVGNPRCPAAVWE
jgi:hypothetical protein